MPNTVSLNFAFQLSGKAFSSNCHQSPELKLLTTNRGIYMNLSINAMSVSLHPDDAKALRDALLEAYPREAPASLGPTPYRAEQDTDWDKTHRSGFVVKLWAVVRDVPSFKLEVAAECKDQASAERIALLLNGGAA